MDKGKEDALERAFKTTLRNFLKEVQTKRYDEMRLHHAERHSPNTEDTIVNEYAVQMVKEVTIRTA